MPNSTVLEQNTNKKTILTPPKKFIVIFLNDDETPFDYVIDLLLRVFNYSLANAIDMANHIHNTGAGMVGTYPFEICEQLVIAANKDINSWDFPLKIDLSPRG